eukprot:7862870-Prorocentrum_lima.AAC.1
MPPSWPSTPGASPSLRHSGSRDMSSSMVSRSLSPKLWCVHGVRMKRAFIATTRDAAIAHVFGKHTMPPPE